MKSVCTIKEGYDNTMIPKSNSAARGSSIFHFENNEFGKKTAPNEKKEFVITSITARLTRINEIFEESKDYDDDIFIFQITGRTGFSAEYTWTIYLKEKEIRELFEQIKKELSKKEIEDEYITIHCKLVKNYSSDELYDNINNIGKFLMNFYNDENGKKLEVLNEALRISATSFSSPVGTKPFEGYALKKAEPRTMRSVLKYALYPVEFLLFKEFNKRWIVLKDDMICYLNSPTTQTGKNVYWFDEDSEISAKEDKVLEIKNLSRILSLKFETQFERDLWKKEIDQRIEKIIDGITNNPYNSFTSQKTNCSAKWFVDGESYFSYLLNQLKGAKDTVYITDWFMSPELALKRPINYEDFMEEDYQRKVNFGNVSRLMDMFYLLAKRGVKIYILLYCEVSLALAINSGYAKETLKRLHPNILITRHPKNDGTLLWSHHEKLVIIDQKMAFVGGLDLCWGRYDTHEHPIVEEENESHTYYYPGCDYVNERQVDLHDVDKFYKEQLDRNSMPRMGWHDVHTMVEGPVVSDIVRHFVERWNDARFNRRDKGIVNAGVSFSAHSSVDIESDKKRKEKRKKNTIFLKKKNTIVENKNFTKHSKTLRADIPPASSNTIDENMEGIKEEEIEEETNKENNLRNLKSIDTIMHSDNIEAIMENEKEEENKEEKKKENKEENKNNN
jgi:phosphatidylserine/phosphatidylglycerophosphate/cardiolipin synthase-like enzyme